MTGLISAGYEIAAVVVAQGDAGKSRKPRNLEVAAVAGKHGIPLLSPVDLEAAKNKLASYGAKAAVLIAYGKIVPASVLELFPAGIINVHPSLLPLHRGSTPIENAVLESDQTTGVSLMKLTEKMDAGPVYETVKVPLRGDETKQTLADKLSGIGAELVLKYLPGMLGDGSVAAPVPVPQDDSKATVDSHITKSDGRVDWSKPALRLEREVRAYAGWPNSRAKLGSTDVIIIKARVAGENLKPGEMHAIDKRLVVGCGAGALEILALKPAGKREMTAEAFLAGYKL